MHRSAARLPDIAQAKPVIGRNASGYFVYTDVTIRPTPDASRVHLRLQCEDEKVKVAGPHAWFWEASPSKAS